MTRKKFFQALPRTAPQHPVRIHTLAIRPQGDSTALIGHAVLGPKAIPAQNIQKTIVPQDHPAQHAADAQELPGALHLVVALLDLPFAGDLTLARLEDAKAPDKPQDLFDEPYVRPPPA
jgi:hypothetical protein